MNSFKSTGEILARLQVFVVLTAVCIWIPAIALAGPPFETDDPEPVEFHHWEAYIGSYTESELTGTTSTIPHFELNYGAVPNLQLHLIVPMVLNSPKMGKRQFGLGDTEVGVKYRFLK